MAWLDAVYGKIMLTISIKFIAAPCRPPAGEKTISLAITGRYLSTNSNYGERERGREESGWGRV